MTWLIPTLQEGSAQLGCIISNEVFYGLFLRIQHCFICRPSESTVSDDAWD
jgi:hypothetical protein